MSISGEERLASSCFGFVAAVALAGLSGTGCSSNSTTAADAGNGVANEADSGTDDSGGSADGNTAETGTPASDGATASADAVSEATTAGDGAPLDGPGSDGPIGDGECDVSPTVPDFTNGVWLICDAVGATGRIWTGTLTITSETPTCSGATLAGKFHWVSTNMGPYQGDTLCRGSYDVATHKIALDEYQVVDGNVGTGTEFMTYDPGTDRLVNGGWACGTGCPTGMWSDAARVPRDGGATCTALDGASDTLVDASATSDAGSKADANSVDASDANDAAADSSTPSNQCFPRPNGMVGWWAGEGNANDSSGGFDGGAGADGVWSGTPMYATGKVGQAFSFASGRYVRAPFTYAGPLSVDLWVLAFTASQVVYSSPFSSSNLATDPYFQIDFDGAGNYRVQTGLDALHVLFGPASTTAYQHLAMTWDGSTIRTYLNGEAANTGIYAGGSLTFTTLKLGVNRTDTGANARPYTGFVDEVHVFDRVLTAAEILGIYQAGANGVCQH